LSTLYDVQYNVHVAHSVSNRNWARHYSMSHFLAHEAQGNDAVLAVRLRNTETYNPRAAQSSNFDCAIHDTKLCSVMLS
jgi:hypothetical protein